MHVECESSLLSYIPIPHSKVLLGKWCSRAARQDNEVAGKRPRKVRVELQFRGQTAVQVYDSADGWKFRPFLNRHEFEPFSEEELKIVSNQEDLDGPLVDYAAKGTHVDLDGTEKVEGNDTYKIKVTEKTGHTFHVWVDSKTFLEAKIEGQPRRLDGTEHPVEVYYRDYRTVDGLQIPFVLKTRVLPTPTFFGGTLHSEGQRVHRPSVGRCWTGIPDD